MSVAEWSVVVGTLMIVMVLVGTLLGRLPLSSAMVYLAMGCLLGPLGVNVLRPDPISNSIFLERIAEVALLISLFAMGLQLGLPLRDRRWRLPLRLAVISMTVMVAMIALVGVWLLDLPLGGAVLLGAILAPTDPVLAADIQSDLDAKRDRVGFSLAGEGGLNDGAAFPFVMLGLGLLGLHELGPSAMRWWSVDLVWATIGGAAIGGGLGAATGWLVVYLRTRHDEAVGLDEFLALGLVGLAYGAAHLSHASGFLAVFAAGLALRRVREQPLLRTPPLPMADQVDGHDYAKLATHPSHASATMRDSVLGFNEQLEKFSELALVLLVGAMLAFAKPLPENLWFVPLVLLVLRPLSTLAATTGELLNPPQRALIGWFGIRGVGSIFYLLLALRHGVAGDTAETIVSLTLWTVAGSIVIHGLTAQPLMHQYHAWRERNVIRS
ncbi:cation:proton antiporter [Tahibacter soli]|jgi:NhaP-type Na+/H+ or K+/H+ antiporter|uniref:Cation:proton antiporter n=1 Tax=Tahibacter soli TaxID=2983605 RepID=A0A9X3YMI8_9GAMM|nr:cation:proton antiporter [Tahibacter soli]MDC8014402.1 cation:proton antiporter [Tahibacter soli]